MARIIALYCLISFLLGGGYASAWQHDLRQEAPTVAKTDADTRPAHAVDGETEASLMGQKTRQAFDGMIRAEMHKACLEIFGIPNGQASDCSLTLQP